MATFGQIQTRVKTRLIDIPARTLAEIPQLVNDAIEEAAREHNFRVMEAIVEFVTSEGTALLGSKPADWKEARYQPYMRDGQDGELGTTQVDYVPTAAELIEGFPVDYPGYGSQPERILEKATTFEVYPFPDSNSQWNDGNYRIAIPYWALPAVLVNDDDTNWWTINASKYVIERATAEGFFVNWDETRGAMWLQKAQSSFKAAKNLDKRTHLPGRMTLTINKGARGFGGRV